MDVSESFGGYRIGLDESYRPLPSVYLAFLSIWFVSACSWTVNTWKNRHFQVISLHSLFLDYMWVACLFWWEIFSGKVKYLLEKKMSFSENQRGVRKIETCMFSDGFDLMILRLLFWLDLGKLMVFVFFLGVFMFFFLLSKECSFWLLRKWRKRK